MDNMEDDRQLGEEQEEQEQQEHGQQQGQDVQGPFSVDSLFAWIRHVAEDRDEDSKQGDNSLLYCVEYVAGLAFGVNRDVHECSGKKQAHGAGRASVLAAIQEIFGEEIMQECSRNIAVMAQASLIKAVANSTDPNIRAFLVSHITQLEDSDKSNLMAIVQDGLQTLISRPNEHLTNHANTSRLQSNISTNGAADGDYLCQTCREKEELINQLQRDIVESIDRERNVDHRLKSELATANTKLVEAELELLEKDKYTTRCLEQLDESKIRVRELEEQLQKQRDKCSELEGLRDEIDILRPLAAKTESNETQLLRMREKLEELADVRYQLKMESQALEETHAKLLNSEQDLDAHRKYKQQVDDYRHQLTESSIEIQDLTIRSSKKDEIIAEMKSRMELLEAGNSCHKQTAQQLEQELHATSEQLRTFETNPANTNGIGSGLCEINPVLMQELHKLRADNELLASKLSSTSMENLASLEKQIEDQKCMNKSLQAKWMDITDALKSANNKIASLQAELLTLSILKAQMKAEFAETCSMASQDWISLAHRHSDKVQYMTQYNNATLMLHEQGRNVLVNEIAAELEDVSSQLSEATECNQHLTEESAGRKRNIEQLEDELTSERQDKKRQREQFELEVTKMQIIHTVDLESEEEKQRHLAVQIEEEKNKKRKVEKEKRLIEAELQRCRTQLQITASGGANGSEIETALKEMKVMKSQLEEAEAEIRSLRAANAAIPACTVSNGSAAAASSPADNATASSGQPTTSAGRAGVAIRSSRVTSSRVLVDSQSTSSSSMGPSAGVSGYGFIDQTAIVSDLNDKRVDQLQKEKREMIARNLEENKERIELSQKLMQSEREVQTLKAKLTKTELEKERIERKFNQAAAKAGRTAPDAENVVNMTF
jgi:hypothetical protein